LVFLPDDAKWVRNFVEECALFPGGAHDDQVDCLSMFCIRASTVRDEIRDVFKQTQEFNWGFAS
jgi:phage terminase large subunit-like protein